MGSSIYAPEVRAENIVQLGLFSALDDFRRGGRIETFFGRREEYHRWTNREEGCVGWVPKIFKNLPWSPFMFFRKFWSKT
jgi:hypothetical protein